MYLTKKLEDELISSVQKAVQTRSYSGEEDAMARLFHGLLVDLGFDEVLIDSVGNVVGRIGSGQKIIHFDGHLDTVCVNDAKMWRVPPFSGDIVDGAIWGRGSVDMKSALCAAAYGAFLAKERNCLQGKTVYVTGTVCEEYCDGVNLIHLYKVLGITPDYCIICEPSSNVITLGHKGKAQLRVTTHGISAHGSAPDKGKNAVYEMAEIINRVEDLNRKLSAKGGNHGTIALSDISCVCASLNAVPSQCSIYLDRRLAFGETLEQVKKEMDKLISGKDAHWEVGTLSRTSWKGVELMYEPMHDPWTIDESHTLTLALRSACQKVFGREVDTFDYWDFGTNAVTPVSMGIPVIGFGPGDYKLAHMRDEHCSVDEITAACKVYAQLIDEL